MDRQLCVDGVTVVYRNNRDYVLLIKRLHEPFKDCLALPGGRVDHDEDIDDAIIRESQEETNYGGTKHEWKKMTFRSNKIRDPRKYTTTCVYYRYICDFNIINSFKAGDDAKEILFIPIDEINNYEYAFDHKDILYEVMHNNCYVW